VDDPIGYLFTTAMNVFRHRYRRANLAALTPITRPRPDPLDQIDDRDVLVRALSELTPRQRAAVVLTTVLDYPSKDAARILRIKDSTVRALTTQARAHMRRSLGDER
jgi:RNA polymerase sigma factor (sigma-70 family)